MTTSIAVRRSGRPHPARKRGEAGGLPMCSPLKRAGIRLSSDLRDASTQKQVAEAR